MTRAVTIYGNAKTLATKHEVEDAELPILEFIDVRMGLGIEIEKRAGRDEIFATTFTPGKEKWDIGDLFGDDIDGAVHPDDLLVGIGKTGTGGKIGAGKPSGGVEGTGDRWRGGASDVKAEDFHAN